MVSTKNSTTIRPCILVAARSHVTGGVTYTRSPVRKLPDAIAAVGETEREIEQWETTKITDDKDEHERAKKAQGRARGEISKLCLKTAFGLVCPIDREGELVAAIDRAHGHAEAHNTDPSTRYTRVSLFVMRGQVAATDEGAIKAIGDEVRKITAQWNDGIAKLDVKGIRKASEKARSLAAMLDGEQSVIVSEARKAAMKAANTIAKRVDRDGEIAAIVLADIQRGAIERARIEFLDLDDGPALPIESDSEPMVTANVQRVAELDLDGDEGEGESEGEGEGEGEDEAKDASAQAMNETEVA